MDIVATVRAEASAEVIPGAITLAEFVSAGLDKDEAIARGAADPDPVWTQPDPERFPGRIEDSAGVVVYDEGAPTKDQAAHIALHDPDRVLREISAKRKILADCQRLQDAYDADPGPVNAAALQAVHGVLLALAYVHSGEWAGPTEGNTR